MPTPTEGKTIVIGAGAAGLACAQELRRRGIEVVVLEASERTGGRIKWDEGNFIPGTHIDLGAEFVHGDNNSLFRLAKERGWAMEEVFTWAQGDGGPLPARGSGGYARYYLGNEDRMLQWDSQDADFVRINEYLGGLSELSPDDTESDTRTLLQALPEAGARERARMLGLVEAGYANTAGGALRDMSFAGTCYLEREWEEHDGEGDFRIQGSFRLVAQALAKDLTQAGKVKMGWPVTKVDYSAAGGGVHVWSVDGRCERGAHAVVAVPLTVMQDQDIEFVPALPAAKRKALSLLGMERAVKLLLKFNRACFPAGLEGVICADCFVPEFWFRWFPGPAANAGGAASQGEEAEAEGGNAQAGGGQEQVEGEGLCLAVGFATGPFADRIASMEPEQALVAALDQLDRMFQHATATAEVRGRPASTMSSGQTPPAAAAGAPVPAAPSSSYVEGMVHDWADEAYVRGGYSYPRPGFTSATPAAVARPVGDDGDGSDGGSSGGGGNGRVFFAGEHTNVGAGMTVHAAMDSGLRAAREVVEQGSRAGTGIKRKMGSV